MHQGANCRNFRNFKKVRKSEDCYFNGLRIQNLNLNLKALGGFMIYQVGSLILVQILQLFLVSIILVLGVIVIDMSTSSLFLKAQFLQT